MMNDFYKLPRLFVTTNLILDDVIALDESQAHYLQRVMRRKEGDKIRLFNGVHGEWLGRISDITKKRVMVILCEQIKKQPADSFARLLYFAPIKKIPLSWMIEKAVELGVTDLHPVLTQNTQNSHLKTERVEQQIIEASEQCERLNIPVLHPIIKLENLKMPSFPLLACLERQTGQSLLDIDKNQNLAVLIGPEGGFSAQEIESIQHLEAVSICLGDRILRAETAAIKALSLICD